MPDRAHQPRRAVGPLVLAAVVAFWIAIPVAVLAGARGAPAPGAIRAFAPAPGQSCPDTTPGPGATELICADVIAPDTPGAGGFDLGVLLPVLGVVAAAGIVALAAFYVLRRRASEPLAPAEPGDWWTCRNCGKSNVSGSPRCYACGAWQA